MLHLRAHRGAARICRSVDSHNADASARMQFYETSLPNSITPLDCSDIYKRVSEGTVIDGALLGITHEFAQPKTERGCQSIGDFNADVHLAQFN